MDFYQNKNPQVEKDLERNIGLSRENYKSIIDDLKNRAYERQEDQLLKQSDALRQRDQDVQKVVTRVNNEMNEIVTDSTQRSNDRAHDVAGAYKRELRNQETLHVNRYAELDRMQKDRFNKFQSKHSEEIGRMSDLNFETFKTAQEANSEQKAKLIRDADARRTEELAQIRRDFMQKFSAKDEFVEKIESDYQEELRNYKNIMDRKINALNKRSSEAIKETTDFHNERSDIDLTSFREELQGQRQLYDESLKDYKLDLEKKIKTQRHQEMLKVQRMMDQYEDTIKEMRVEFNREIKRRDLDAQRTLQNYVRMTEGEKKVMKQQYEQKFGQMEMDKERLTEKLRTRS
jgi:hypothetical protein